MWVIQTMRQMVGMVLFLCPMELSRTPTPIFRGVQELIFLLQNIHLINSRIVKPAYTGLIAPKFMNILERLHRMACEQCQDTYIDPRQAFKF